MVWLTCNTSKTHHGLTAPSRLLKLRSHGTETQPPRGEVPAVVPARELWLRAVEVGSVGSDHVAFHRLLPTVAQEQVSEAGRYQKP